MASPFKPPPESRARTRLRRKKVPGMAIIGLVFCVLRVGEAQQTRSAETGNPYIHNFGSADSDAPGESYATVQDRRGIVYVGSEAVVNEYDGISWREIPTGGGPRSIVRSLAQDPNTGRVWVGSTGDFGYLDSDSTGRLKFKSLLDKVPIKHPFSDVWSIVQTPSEGTFFQAARWLFRFVNDQAPIQVFSPHKLKTGKNGEFQGAICIGGRLYVGDTAYGLLRLEGDSLVRVPGSEQFIDEGLVDARRLVLMPYGNSKILIGRSWSEDTKTRFKSPLFLYDGSKLAPFPTGADKILSDHMITCGQPMKDDRFALGTKGGGLVIIDQSGHLLWHIAKEARLRGDVHGIYPNENGLWVNLSSGVSRVELPPPLSYFVSYAGDKYSIEEGAKYSIVRHLGSLYVGTNSGVYKLYADGVNAPHFTPIAGTSNSSARALVSVGEGSKARLFLGNSSGLFEIVKDKPVPIIPHRAVRPYQVTSMVVSKRDPNRIWVGLTHGLASVRVNASGVEDEGNFAEVAELDPAVQKIVEQKNGRIWLATQISGVVRVSAETTAAEQIPDRNAPVDQFFVTKGRGLNVFELGGNLLFTSNDLKQLYRLDEANRKFSPLDEHDPLIMGASPDPDPKRRGFGFQEDHEGNIWTFRGKDLVFLAKKGDGYQVDKKHLAHGLTHAADLGNLSIAFPEEDGVVWFGSTDQLIRYESASAQPETVKYSALIRRVVANLGGAKGESPIIYEGAGLGYPIKGPSDSSNSDLKFEFAGPITSDESATEFRTKIDGSEKYKNWSEWEKKSSREFTNLPYGDFTFRVEGRNGSGDKCLQEAAFSFSIPKPLYLEWWAITGYGLALAIGLLVFLWGLGRSRRARRLEVEKESLNAEKSLLTEFSKDHSALDFEAIFLKLWEHVKDLCDVAVFRAGRLDADGQQLEYSVVLAGAQRMPGFSVATTPLERMEAWCISRGLPVLFRNAPEETGRYIEADGEDADLPARIYLPLISKGRVRGLVAFGSPRKNAYGDYDFHLLQTLTAYTSIALDNADAHSKLNSTLENLENTVRARTLELSEQAETLQKAYETVESLSEVGKQITASLDLDTVLVRVYKYVSHIADGTLFGVGLLVPEEHKIEYLLAMMRGERAEHYRRDTRDPNQFAVWCIQNRQPVVMNDVENEYTRYIEKMDQGGPKLEEGGRPLSPASIVYIPLMTQDHVMGVMTVQSFEKNAYSPYQVNLLKSLAAYTSIAIDNATAYKRLNEREREIHQQAAELATVNEVGQLAASTLDVRGLILQVGDKVRDVFKAQVAYVGIHDPAAGLLTFPYGHGREFPPLPAGRGLAWRVLRGRKPLLINEDTTDGRRTVSAAQMDAGTTSFMGVPIRAGGEFAGVIGVQITDEQRRFNENDLRLLVTIAASVGVAMHNARLFEDVKAADAAKGNFLSTVSHELRTPLTSVMGFAKIIKRRLSERLFPLIPVDDKKIVQTMQQVSENLDVVVSEGQRLTKLIDEVLDLAKIESGKIEWRIESLSAPELIGRAVAATSSLVENKPVSLSAEIEPDLPPFMGDRDRLIQVVINLISNAVKFTSQGPVTCRAKQVGSEIVISVTDTGLGISPEDQPKVFEKFKQVGDTLTDKPKGTGLGLPICKEIVEHHGGRIWVESEPGKGSTFSFSIPLKVETPVAPQPLSLESLVRRLRESAEGGGATTGRPSILVVDDDLNIRELLRQELHEAGHTVRLASNGREALNSIRDEKPGLVVLDVVMPEMDGFDVAAVLRNDPVTMDVPIVMLSILEDRQRGYRLGIDRYLTKPVDTRVLLKEVSVLMEQGKSRKKVMIVDEDATTVRTLTEVLEIRGYHVVETNGGDVMQQALSLKPDVIILNSSLSSDGEAMHGLRFENGLENVLFLIYQ